MSREIINPALYKSLQCLIIKSLKILKIYASSSLVVSSETDWVKQNSSTYVKREIRRPQWFIVFHQCRDEIEASKEFATFIEVINEEEAISSHLDNMVGTCVQKGRFEAKTIINFLLSPFLTDTQIIDFDENLFLSEYLKIEKELYSTDIELERITPIYGFISDVQEIVLTPNLSIVRLNDSEISRILNLGINLGTGYGTKEVLHGIHKFAIKVSYSLPKIIDEEEEDEGKDTQEIYEEGDIEKKVFNALRLYKEGKIHPIVTLYLSKSIFTPGISYGHEAQVRYSMTNSFNIKQNEEKEFVEFWKNYDGLSTDEKHFLSVAIRRFSQANERTSAEDKIIDYLISAEALFLSSGGSFQGELKYRLSHRAAMFIESEPNKQHKIFKFMQKAYDVRSAIVHGAIPKLPKNNDGTQISLDKFCQEVEEHLRFSLNKTINLASGADSPNKIIEWEKVVFPVES